MRGIPPPPDYYCRIFLPAIQHQSCQFGVRSHFTANESNEVTACKTGQLSSQARQAEHRIQRRACIGPSPNSENSQADSRQALAGSQAITAKSGGPMARLPYQSATTMAPTLQLGPHLQQGNERPARKH